MAVLPLDDRERAIARADDAWRDAGPVAVRALALRALATLDLERAVAEILGVLQTEDAGPDLAAAAVQAASIAGAVAAPPLKAAARSAGPMARAQLLRAVDAVEPLSPDALIELAGGRSPDPYRVWAAERLALAGDPRGAPVLQALSLEGAALVRIEAAGARLRAGDASALPLLLPSLWGPTEVRPAVERALADLPEVVLERLQLYAPRAAANPMVGAATLELLSRRRRAGAADAALAATQASDDRLGVAALVACARLEVGEVGPLLARRVDGRAPDEVVALMALVRESAPPLLLSLIQALAHHGAVPCHLLAFEAILAHPRASILALVGQHLEADPRPDPVHQALLENHAYRTALDATFDGVLLTPLHTVDEDLRARALSAWERAPTDRLASVALAIVQAGLSELAGLFHGWSRSAEPAVRALAMLGLQQLAPWRLSPPNG